MKRKGPRRRGVHLLVERRGETSMTLCGKFGRERRNGLQIERSKPKVTCPACLAELERRMAVS